MKKMNVVLSGALLAVLGCTIAFAYPVHGHFVPRCCCGNGKLPPPPPQHRPMKNEWGISPDAPEEIKNAHKEMKELRHDLRAELSKNKPDAAKALEMVKKSEELHAKVREWQVKQILEGKAPKPGMRKAPGPRGPMRAMPAPGCCPCMKQPPKLPYTAPCIAPNPAPEQAPAK